MTRIATLLLLIILATGCEKQAMPAPAQPDAGASMATTTDAGVMAPIQREANYVGSEQCQLCHVAQHQDWLHSDHYRAMKTMNPKDVAGHFDQQSLEHHGQQTGFSMDNGRYLVSTDQQSGSAATLELQYTFGHFPLQQYLTALPDGRWQNLPFAWDARAKEAGGQRWYHLYEQEKITPDDALHWRSPSHNANHMCIECHTTNFAKSYNANTNSFHSSWQETGVGCESCHGPGSRHIEWARSSNKGGFGNKGWDINLTDGSLSLWQHQTAQTPAKRQQAADSSQIEQCAQCHARRSRIHASNHEHHFLDAFLPSLLEEGLYHADGQIDDEVYEYGSFMQSKMAIAGVTCSNCHNPHSGKPKVAGNGLCLQCHDNSFDTPQHSMHTPGQPGSFCVDCHMPTKTYMTVDARRDHSLRVPRPDLTTGIGTPNACNQCHTSQTAEWASNVLDQHHGKSWRKPHYGQILASARQAKPAAYSDLVNLIRNQQQPAIVRATAIMLLPNFPARDYRQIIAGELGNADALVRLGALRAADSLPPQERRILLPLLRDEQRAIRIEAARLLAGNPLVAGDRDFASARQEYIDSQMINADRAAALTNLASVAIQENRWEEAEGFLQDAIRKEPYFIPASINLADVYRATSRDAEGAKVLQASLQQNPENSDLQLAYALWLVRAGQTNNALPYLQQAASHSQNPHFSYIYALGLQQLGKTDEALAVLDKAAAMPRYDRNVHIARIDIARQSGQVARAGQYLREWKTLDPEERGN